MYLTNQDTLPKPAGRAAGSEARWRLHFEYGVETEQQAEAHARVCRSRSLRVQVDNNGKPARRRLTTAVLNAVDGEHKELDRFSEGATCSWTDTFNKETGRRTALGRLETLLKAGAGGRLSGDDGRTLARATRKAYSHRERYRPLVAARVLLSNALDRSRDGQTLNESTRKGIADFLKQLNV